MRRPVAGLKNDPNLEGRPAKPRAKLKKQPSRNIDDKVGREAALAFEREQKRRKSERRKEEAARAKEHERRQKATVKAEAALAKAKREHDKRASAIEAERTALDKRSQAEHARWEKQREKLEIALRRARG
jgi:colicin import membrane protein